MELEEEMKCDGCDYSYDEGFEDGIRSVGDRRRNRILYTACVIGCAIIANVMKFDNETVLETAISGVVLINAFL